MNKIQYITTTLPYVNADPHIGFALEIIQADVWARTQTLMGNEVIFNTGTDEHGLKIYQNAKDASQTPKDYVDHYASRFELLKKALDLSYTNFIRTTDEHHIAAAQEFWMRCLKNDDIYKKIYSVKYCVGCELPKTESELVDGKCPLHPTRELTHIEEENYFFRFSKYEKPLLELYSKNPDFVIPEHRLSEIVNFVKGGLEDFSISRLREKMPWGVPVPGDMDHVMYVWFDALVNYISTLGWPDKLEVFDKAWPGVQIAGKDNLRQQAAMWQAMLMSARIPTSEQIVIHGFITSDGKKMSKSMGNVVNPLNLVSKYGTDPVRYYLLREMPAMSDGDYSESRMYQLYTSDLSNELGNLLSRITTLAEKDGIEVNNFENKFNYFEDVMQFSFDSILEKLWVKIKVLNREINDVKPWSLSREDRHDVLVKWLQSLSAIGFDLSPFLPNTAKKILDGMTGVIKKSTPLFPRLKL